MHGQQNIATDTPGMIGTTDCAKVILLVLLIAHGAQATAPQHLSLSQDLVTTNGMRSVYATVEGVPYWRLLPHLWVDKTVKLHWNHGKVKA